MARYFTKDEFDCKCGCGFNNVSDDLVAKLDQARHEYGAPMVVTSGCRCKAHNAKVGGVGDSTHVLGEAADIATTNETRLPILRALIKRFDRVFVDYNRNFIHVDVSTTKPSPRLGTY